MFRAPNHAETERRAAESLLRLAGPASSEKTLPRIPSEARTGKDLSPISPTYPPPPQYTSIAAPPTAYAAPSAEAPDNEALKLECSRAIATFLTPDSMKELPLDAVVRDTAVRNLSLSSHPDVVRFAVSLPKYGSHTRSVHASLRRNIYPAGAQLCSRLSLDSQREHQSTKTDILVLRWYPQHEHRDHPRSVLHNDAANAPRGQPRVEADCGWLLFLGFGPSLLRMEGVNNLDFSAVPRISNATRQQVL